MAFARRLALWAVLTAASVHAHAQSAGAQLAATDVQRLGPVEVSGRYDDGSGIARTATCSRSIVRSRSFVAL